jgi:hypothetical protein
VTEICASSVISKSPVLATAAGVTSMADEELKKLGWTIVALK